MVIVKICMVIGVLATFGLLSLPSRETESDADGASLHACPPDNQVCGHGWEPWGAQYMTMERVFLGPGR